MTGHEVCLGENEARFCALILLGVSAAVGGESDFETFIVRHLSLYGEEPIDGSMVGERVRLICESLWKQIGGLEPPVEQ